MKFPKYFFAAVLASAAFTGTIFASGLPRTSDHDYDTPSPGSYNLPVVKPAADGEVLDSKGQALHLRELTRGRITVVSFIYTRCAAAKACPYATGVLMQLHQLSAEDTALARSLRLVSISFDPGNDTPERMVAAGLPFAGQVKTAIQIRKPIEGLGAGKLLSVEIAQRQVEFAQVVGCVHAAGKHRPGKHSQ